MNVKTKGSFDKNIIALLILVIIKFGMTYFTFPSMKVESWFVQCNMIVNIILILCATLVLVRTLKLIFHNRIELDRILSEGKWKNVLHIIAFILSVPLFVYGIMWVLSYIPCCRVRLMDLLGNNFIESPGMMWTVFYYFTDPGNQHMATTHVGQMWAMIIALLGSALMSGLLVSYLTNLFDRRGEDYLNGHCRYNYKSSFGKFIVIIGGHEMTIGLCKKMFNEMSDLDYIFIHTSSDVEQLRSKLRSTLGEKESKVVVYYGDRSIEAELDALYCNCAERIYILGEDGQEPLHDAKNMKCVSYLTEHVTKELPCYVLFEYQTSFSAFQASNKRASHVKEKNETDKLIFIPFNFHETWAQKVLTGEYDEKADYLPLDGSGIGYESDETIHVIIIGMSRMGVAMGVESAHIAHYPNFIRNNNLRTRITFIDSNMSEEHEYFISRFKSMFDISRWRYLDKDNMQGEWNNKNETLLDIEWEFIEGGIQSPHVYDYLQKAVLAPNKKITIMVCLPITNQAIASALYLPSEVYTNEQVQQILVYQKHEDAIAANLKTGEKYKKLKPFGMTCNSYAEALIIDSPRPRLTAQVYDTVWNLKYNKESFSEGNLYRTILQSLKDVKNVKRGWNRNKIWGQWSNIYNSCSIPTKNRCVPLNDNELVLLRNAVDMVDGVLQIKTSLLPEDLQMRFRLLAELEHNRWNVEKLLMGYRPLSESEKTALLKIGIGTDEYNKEKDRLKGDAIKAHADICPFKELKNIDPGIEDYDYLLTLMIPDIKNLPL